MPAIRSFKGLNNTADPVRLGLQWLTRADNIDITDSGGIQRRVGCSLQLPGARDALYATGDESRMYVVEGGELRQVLNDLTMQPLASGLGRETHWAEINDHVLYASGHAAGIIAADGAVLPWRLPVPDEPRVGVVPGGALPAGPYRVCCTFVLPDGRETPASPAAEIVVEQGERLHIDQIDQLPGARTRVYIAPAGSTVFQLALGDAGPSAAWTLGPEALGHELVTDGLDPLPAVDGPIAAWRGRVYAAQYLPEQDQSVVWRSEPLAPHLWDLSAGFFMVPGRVLALAPHDTALVVGSHNSLHAYTPEALTRLADYGTVAGLPWAEDGNRLLIWTQRGLCQFPEFSNLTERRVSVAPGTHAAAAVLEMDGQVRFVACLHAGGNPFNQRLRGTP